ncbi:MAG TPA: lipopolysaccharide heptosyltransferase II, partial [Rhodocyclaceae bacterium]|nr:lipopolysaccharide heptosyltransferase II [Rhodocyclaceae bacterium]
PAWSAPLLSRMPEVAQVIANPFGHGEFKLSARRRLGRQLAAAGYERAFVLPNSWKSALVPFFAGIGRRTGYTGEARVGLLNDRRRLDKAALPLLVERYAALAEPAGAPLPRPLPQPRLTSSREQQAAARAALGLPSLGAPIVFCPGAEYGPAKRWPARHYAELARRLSAAGPVWLVGSAKDAAVGEEIAGLSQGAAVNLCGRTDLAQAIDLLAAARLVVSNDSGLMHVAAALGRPLAALFGSSSPAYTPPLSPKARILSLALECSPCFKRECPLGHLKCLNELTPDRVMTAAQELIEP